MLFRDQEDYLREQEEAGSLEGFTEEQEKEMDIAEKQMADAIVRNLRTMKQEEEVKKNLSISDDMAKALNRVCENKLMEFPSEVSAILDAYDSVYNFVGKSQSERKAEIARILSQDTIALENALGISKEWYRTRYIAALQVISNLIGCANEPTTDLLSDEDDSLVKKFFSGKTFENCED